MSKQLFIQNADALKTGTSAINVVDAFPTDLNKVVLMSGGSNVPITQSTSIGNEFSVGQITDWNNDGILVSETIKTKDVVDVQLSLYEDEVKQQTEVTGFPTDSEASQITLKVVRLDKGYKEFFMNFTVEPGSTATQTATRIENEINAQSKIDPAVGEEVFITASRSGTTVTLEGINGEVVFNTSMTDEFSNSVGTITGTQAPSTGTGTQKHLKKIEEYAWGVQGYTNRTWLTQTQEPKSYVNVPNIDIGTTPSAAVGWDLVTLSIETSHGKDGIASPYSEIALAFPASATAGDSLLANNSVTEADLKSLFSV